MPIPNQEFIQNALNQELASAFVVGENLQSRLDVLSALMQQILPPADPEDSHFIVNNKGRISIPTGWSSQDRSAIQYTLRAHADAVAVIEPEEESWPTLYSAIEMGTAVLLTLSGSDGPATFHAFIRSVSKALSMPEEPLQMEMARKRPLIIRCDSKAVIIHLCYPVLSGSTLSFKIPA